MPTRRSEETPETIRCIRCAQDAPRARPKGHLCRPCEDALDGIHRGAVREKKQAREARKAQAPADPPAPAPKVFRCYDCGREMPYATCERVCEECLDAVMPVLPAEPPAPVTNPAQEAPAELEVLRAELEAVRAENLLLTRGVNLLLGCVAEDLPPSRALAIVTWEREWRMHRHRPGTTPPG